jgi:arylsulfatase
VHPPELLNGVAQMPVHGESLAYTFDAGSRELPTRKQSQYFEMYGSRAIFSGGWKAVTFHKPGTPFDDDRWELYHLDTDFSECRDLAREQPERLAKMIELWWTEAGRYGVLPLDDRRAQLWTPSPRTRMPRNRERYVLYPPVAHMSGEVAPRWATAASPSPPNSIGRLPAWLSALGSAHNGIAFYVLGDRLVFDYNLFATHYKAVSDRPIPEWGRHRVGGLEKIGEAGRATVSIDGVACGRVDVPKVLRMISSNGMDAGRDAGSAVSDDYQVPFDFQGTIKRLVFDLPRRPKRDEREARAAQQASDLSRQ